MNIKWARRGVWTLAWGVTLVSLFYAVENWRGARAWKAYEAELRARGEPLTVREVLPERPSDELNMAMAPVFTGLFDFKKEWDVHHKRFQMIPLHPEVALSHKQIGLPGEPASGIEPALGRGADLKKIREACARDPGYSYIPPTLADGPFLWEAMRLHADLYRQVEEAAARPRVYWPLAYEEGINCQVPQIGSLLTFAKAFTLRAVVSLETGKTGEAYRDWLVVQRLAESQAGQPLLISHLVGLSMENLSMQVVWEGLRRGAWSDAQLRDIETRLAKKDIAGNVRKSMRGERANMLSIMSDIHLRDLFLLTGPVGGGGGSVGEWLAAILIYGRPQGWLDLEKRECARMFQDYLISDLVLPDGRYEVARLDGVLADMKKPGSSRLDLLKKPILLMTFPSLAPVAAKSAQSEAMIRQGILACALERYRREFGHYPERLDPLQAGSRFRRDPVSDGDMVYRLENGGYVIYSVGWNLKDEGGAYDPKKRNGGDWPWRMPGGSEDGKRGAGGGIPRK